MRSVSVVTSGGDVAGTWDVPEICKFFQMKKMLAEKVSVDQHLVHGHIDLRGQGFVHMGFGMGKWRGSYHGTEGETHTTPRSWSYHGPDEAILVRVLPVLMEQNFVGGAGEALVRMKVKKRRLSSRHVSVVTPGGSEVGSWEVPKHCNVLRMKQIIADRTGTHPLDQRLLHGSTMLVDGDLRELGVASGALLTLIQIPKTFVMTASEDHTVKIFNVASGQAKHHLRAHRNFVLSTIISRNRKWILTISGDGTALLWCTATFTRKRTFNHSPELDWEEHDQWVECSAFAPNSIDVITAGSDKKARLWRVDSEACVHVLRGHTHTVRSTDFSSDGVWVITASLDTTVRMWDVSSGECLHLFRQHVRAVSTAVFSPDNTVLSASDDHTAALWESATGKWEGYFEGHLQEVRSAKFSPAGTHEVTASDDCTARIWNVSSQNCTHVLWGPPYEMVSATFCPRGIYIVTVAEECSVRLWSAKSGHFLKQFMGHSDQSFCAEFSECSAWLVTSSFDGTAKLWSIEQDSCYQTFNAGGAIWCAAFCPIG